MTKPVKVFLHRVVGGSRQLTFDEETRRVTYTFFDRYGNDLLEVTCFLAEGTEDFDLHRIPPGACVPGLARDALDEEAPT